MMRVFIAVHLVIFLLFSWARAAQENRFNIRDRINTQSVFLKNYDSMFGHHSYARSDSFIKAINDLDKGKRRQATQLSQKLLTKLPNKVVMPIVQWSLVAPNQQKLRQALVMAQFLRLLPLRDTIDNPLSTTTEKATAQTELQRLTNEAQISSQNIYELMFDSINQRAKLLADALNDPNQLAKKILATPLLNFNSSKGTANYSLSWLGFVPGNNIELISENDRSEERLDWYNDRVIFNNHGIGIDWSLPHFKMPLSTEDDGHIAFKTDPIFIKIRDMILSAKDSIFIDIFLFGGTLGATISKFLVEQTIEKHKSNPNFRTLLLHDFATNYNMKPEMMPVFEYIRDQIATNTYLQKCKCFSLLQANIQRHTPGIPFGLTNLIPKTEDVFKTIEKSNTYYESKIDHSKVIVVDAQTDEPKAYFGSKNWSDHSGGYYYDDALYVEGPAAALVQASFVADVEAALTEDAKEQAWFFFKEDGFGNSGYLDRRAELVNWMKPQRDFYPHLGDQTLRIAEANVDGKIKNVRNIIIDMISRAESHIYMEQLFIYDKYINEALIKKKRQNPSLDIRIIADHNGNFGFNGFPNTMFVKELNSHGIPVKAINTFGRTATFPDGSTQEYHQENHRKILSVDSKTMMVGSSNLNPDTFQGSFREFGAQVFDTREIQKFESRFIAAWNDRNFTQDFEVMGFKLKDTVLSPALTDLINALTSQLVRVKDDLEKRF